MFELLGACMALSALFVVRAAGSAGAMVAWRMLRARIESWPAAARARILFGLGTVPTFVAVLMTFALVVPAYLLHEPSPPREVVGVRLVGLAAVSALGVAMALWRVATRLAATRRLKAHWKRDAVAINLPGATLPTYRIRHPFPVIAVVGVLRPSLFIAEQLLDELDEAELAAAISHETGHAVARDNFKRTVMLACRGGAPFAIPSPSLDRAWSDAAECAADEYAARADARRALDLASALVKIARLVPAGLTPALPAISSAASGSIDGVASRIRRLVALADRSHPIPPGLGPHAWALLRAPHWLLVAGVAAFAAVPGALARLHGTVEVVVAMLT